VIRKQYKHVDDVGIHKKHNFTFGTTGDVNIFAPVLCESWLCQYYCSGRDFALEKLQYFFDKYFNWAFRRDKTVSGCHYATPIWYNINQLINHLFFIKHVTYCYLALHWQEQPG